jgi:hypothetical protein
VAIGAFWLFSWSLATVGFISRAGVRRIVKAVICIHWSMYRFHE